MKIFPHFIIALALILPLHAQTAPDGTAQETSVPPAPAQRSIMPIALNHKPNAVNPPAELAGPIDKFFKGLEAGSYSDAYESFLAGSRLGLQKDKESRMISHTQETFGIYGKMNDYEIFDNYGVGSNVLVLTYLSRHAEQPLRWRFIYYRADKTWKLINMGLDDVLLDMLD